MWHRYCFHKYSLTGFYLLLSPRVIGCRPVGLVPSSGVGYQVKFRGGTFSCPAPFFLKSDSTRSGFKTSDQVQENTRKASGRSEKSLFSAYIGIWAFNGGLCCTLLHKIRCESGSSGATQPLEPFEPHNILSNRCEIPLFLAGRWGFETTYRQHETNLAED